MCLANLEKRGTYTVKVLFGNQMAIGIHYVSTEFGVMIMDARYTPNISAGPAIETNFTIVNGAQAPNLPEQVGAQLVCSQAAHVHLVSSDEKSITWKVVTLNSNTKVFFYTQVAGSIARGGIGAIVEKHHDYKMVQIRDLVGLTAMNPLKSDIDFDPIVRILTYLANKIGPKFISIIAKRIASYYTPAETEFRLDFSAPNEIVYPVAPDFDGVVSLGEALFDPETFFRANVGLVAGGQSVSLGPDQQRGLYCKYVKALHTAIEDNEIQLKLIEGYLGMSVNC